VAEPSPARKKRRVVISSSEDDSDTELVVMPPVSQGEVHEEEGDLGSEETEDYDTGGQEEGDDIEIVESVAGAAAGSSGEGSHAGGEASIFDEFLEGVGVLEHRSAFARHGVGIETVFSLSEADLKHKVGLPREACRKVLAVTAPAAAPSALTRLEKPAEVEEKVIRATEGAAAASSSGMTAAAASATEAHQLRNQVEALQDEVDMQHELLGPLLSIYGNNDH